VYGEIKIEHFYPLKENLDIPFVHTDTAFLVMNITTSLAVLLYLKYLLAIYIEICLGNDWEGHTNLTLCIVKHKIDSGLPREMASLFHHSHVASYSVMYLLFIITNSPHPSLVSPVAVRWGPRQSTLPWN